MFNIFQRIRRVPEQNRGQTWKKRNQNEKPETYTVKRDPLTFIWYIFNVNLQSHLIERNVKASAHSFKQFTSRILKLSFSLSLCTYITRMDVMLDFICIGPVDLIGARRKRQNTKWKIPCPQWDSNPQPFDSKSDALPTELAGVTLNSDPVEKWLPGSIFNGLRVDFQC